MIKSFSAFPPSGGAAAVWVAGREKDQGKRRWLWRETRKEVERVICCRRSGGEGERRNQKKFKTQS